MIIKYPALTQHLRRKLSSIYIITGQDHYLFNDAITQIKKAWYQQGECDRQVLHLNTSEDWNLLIESANSYSLFAEHVLIDAHYDKKTIDSIAKKTLQNYLNHLNSRCLIILRATNMVSKSLQWIENSENVTIVHVQALTPTALQNWIAMQLKAHSIQFEAQVPALIHQYNQHNMLACAQVIEKLAMEYVESDILTTQHVKAHLTEQSDFQLFELADACLAADMSKAILMLRQASQNRTEPTLLLWLMTQEIRQLIQLSHIIKQSVSVSSACNQLKIWSSRTHLYTLALQRLSINHLYTLLKQAQQLDECIKSNQNSQAWTKLEQLVLGFNLNNI